MKEFFIGLFGTFAGVLLALAVHDFIIKKHLAAAAAADAKGGSK